MKSLRWLVTFLGLIAASSASPHWKTCLPALLKAKAGHSDIVAAFLPHYGKTYRPPRYLMAAGLFRSMRLSPQEIEHLLSGGKVLPAGRASLSDEEYLAFLSAHSPVQLMRNAIHRGQEGDPMVYSATFLAHEASLYHGAEVVKGGKLHFLVLCSPPGDSVLYSPDFGYPFEAEAFLLDGIRGADVRQVWLTTEWDSHERVRNLAAFQKSYANFLADLPGKTTEQIEAARHRFIDQERAAGNLVPDPGLAARKTVEYYVATAAKLTFLSQIKFGDLAPFLSAEEMDEATAHLKENVSQLSADERAPFRALLVNARSRIRRNRAALVAAFLSHSLKNGIRPEYAPQIAENTLSMLEKAIDQWTPLFRD